MIRSERSERCSGIRPLIRMAKPISPRVFQVNVRAVRPSASLLFPGFRRWHTSGACGASWPPEKQFHPTFYFFLSLSNIFSLGILLAARLQAAVGKFEKKKPITVNSAETWIEIVLRFLIDFTTLHIKYGDHSRAQSLKPSIWCSFRLDR